MTLVLCFPIMLMAYNLLTLWLNLLPPAPLHLLVTRWNFLCVCVLKKLCLKFALLLCVYSIPQNTYSDVEMSGGTIRPLSGHPTFPSYLVFRVFTLHNPSVSMAPYWNRVVQMRRPVLTLLAPHPTGGGDYIWVLLVGSNDPTDSLESLLQPHKEYIWNFLWKFVLFFCHIFPVHPFRYQLTSHYIILDCLLLSFGDFVIQNVLFWKYAGIIDPFNQFLVCFNHCIFWFILHRLS